MIKKISFISLLASASLINADTLSEKLEARENQGSSKVSPEIKKAFAEGIAAVDEAGIVKKAKQIGEAAPDFTLKDAAGKKVTLSEELKNGPVVLTWYRGGW